MAYYMSLLVTSPRLDVVCNITLVSLELESLDFTLLQYFKELELCPGEGLADFWQDCMNISDRLVHNMI